MDLDDEKKLLKNDEITSLIFKELRLEIWSNKEDIKIIYKGRRYKNRLLQRW